MSRYRLPDSLGGIPVTVADKGPNESGTWRVIVNLEQESFPLWLPPTVLVEIADPEPENGYVGICDSDVWQRDDLTEMDGGSPGVHWWRTGSLEGSTYVGLLGCLNGRTMTQLIAHPADAVRESRITIPTAHADQQLHIDSPTGDGYLPVWITGTPRRALISPEGAEQAAAVLLRGAREARAAQ